MEQQTKKDKISSPQATKPKVRVKELEEMAYNFTRLFGGEVKFNKVSRAFEGLPRINLHLSRGRKSQEFTNILLKDKDTVQMDIQSFIDLLQKAYRIK